MCDFCRKQQRKRMTEIQKDVDAKLETLLTEEQKKQLQVMRQTPPPAKGLQP